MLSVEKKERIQLAFKAYWLSPFCTGTILLGEPLLSWALEAQLLETKAYADAYDTENKIAYQLKTGLPTSPVTFARLTTSSQAQLVNSSKFEDIQQLGYELLEWVANRIQEPLYNLGAKEVRVARLIYTKAGDFTYYERVSDPTHYQPDLYRYKWSENGNALELHRDGLKWFSWYPQGRLNSKNQNQLHFHGENHLMPDEDSLSRFSFRLGLPAQISFEEMLEVLLPLVDKP